MGAFPRGDGIVRNGKNILISRDKVLALLGLRCADRKQTQTMPPRRRRRGSAMKRGQPPSSGVSVPYAIGIDREVN
jgi:hypothetical protein